MTEKGKDEGKNERRPPSEGDRPTAFERFDDFVKRLIRVPKSEVSKEKPPSS